MRKEHIFGVRLKKLREGKNLTQDHLAETFSVTRPAVGNWEKGAIPREPILSGIAKLFNVSPAYLMGWEDDPTPPQSNNLQIKKAPVKGVKIPVLGKIIAGVPIEAVTDILDYEEIHPDLAKTGEFFGLKVKGDSMIPQILENDIVIVKKQPDINSGELAVVLVNGEDATLKKVLKKEDGIVLEAFNPADYSPKFYSYSDIEQLPVVILGKVVEQKRSW